jgi:Pin2-interacting protein X1
MLSQGWKAGEGLGARNRRGFNSYDNAKLKVSFKDDNLGLGASLKSKDVEASRTGLDAFQGLLGRLNGKSEQEVEAVERKVEERKLAMFAQGKWGGMVFVSGGLLVQRDDFKVNEEISEKQREFKAMRNDAEAIAKAKGRKKGGDDGSGVPAEEDDAAAKARRKQERAEKRQRKEERRRRREADNPTELETNTSNETSAADIPKKKEKKAKSLPTPPDDTSVSNTDTKTEDIPESAPPPPASRPMPRNGRQILRGKNIAAKKMAFADAKLLDEIFMRKS